MKIIFIAVSVLITIIKGIIVKSIIMNFLRVTLIRLR